MILSKLVNKFSIVVPFFNEYENIINIHTEIESVIKFIKNIDFEIIFVDDASNDGSFEIFKKLEKDYKIKLITNKSNLGQSKSIFLGIKKSSFDNIITLDGDGQNDPNDIPKLIEFYQNKNCDLLGGIRKKRKDSILKIISSIVANSIRSAILKDNCKCTGCSLKIFKKNIFLKFPFFNGMHRFLPALFNGYGYETFFIDVNHRRRKYGTSKYDTFFRLIYGIRDIMRVSKIIRKHNDRFF